MLENREVRLLYVTANIVIIYVIKNLYFRNLIPIFAVLFGPVKAAIRVTYLLTIN